jgi:phage tail sheath protein FI
MIVNQPIQYEWALPTNRTHNLKIGELDYKTPKHVLDAWQAASGVGVNAITEIPGQGVTVWGNSTLFDVPPATYNALQNLSTRYLVNAVKDIIYRCGISITFQYNNQQAYNKFYAGVTPTLDTMKNTGAIEDYYVTMAADINGLDQVNANSVIGKVYLIVNGVINNITVDLIALPPGVDLTQFQ